MNSVFTTNFPHILHNLGISLVISTYQAGNLIIVRADGDKLNTHFRKFDKPMGLATDRDKIALGSTFQILEFRNLPAVTGRLEPPHKHDACYLLRQSHVTGDIDIHEMSYVDDAIWFINTRFSCLCTIDRVHSFVPRWRPPFISGYDLTDRCHLNGLGLKDGKPRYVTALGETDTAGGWRASKARGGMLMDITNNEFICRGLSMPHSPRWYRNQLWVLESGNGSIATVDLATGKLTTIAELPGFTRGIDFWGDLAFIGLSQVRETAVFSGIPLTQRLTDRICGVWVVNIVTGETLGFLRFTEVVQEIFAVAVLPYRYPDILEQNDNLLTNSFFLPDEAFRDVVQPEPPQVPERAIDAFSVVVPIHNTIKRGKGVLQKTLRSIEASITYYLEKEKPEFHCKYEIILVNDCSTDGTWDSVKRFVKGKSFYRLIEHDRNRGLAATRNTGVRASTGRAIFFCDDDDLYFPEHIWTILQVMNKPLSEKHRTAFSLPFNFPGIVRTGVHIEDLIHPDWKKFLESVLCLNMCIRKEVHEFIEGFPEEDSFRTKHGMEDTVYSNWLKKFCSIVFIPQETVEYVRYPGNHLDRQLHNLLKPPSEAEPDKTITPEEQEQLKLIDSIFEQRLSYLHQKINHLTKTSVPNPPDRVIDGFSVIVPIHNTQKRGKGVLQRTLRSIETSIAYYLEQEKPEFHCQYEIILINDCSTDGTWEAVKRFVKGKKFYHLIEHDRNCGQATARNTGAKAATGKALFFCDDDDLYYPQHIWATLQLMNQPLASSSAKFTLPFNFPCAVRMAVHTDDSLHPHWKSQMEKVLCLNLCVRKEAHDFVGGFPEDEVFHLSQFCNEDTVYANWLANFCSIVLSSEETVEYVRYPGNLLDKQLKKFQHPPGAIETPIPIEEQARLQEMDKIFHDRLQYLQGKLDRATTNIDSPEMIFQKGNELFKQGDLDSALQCYRQCVELNPGFTQAKYNLAITLRDLERPLEAFPIFEEIVKVQPDHADAWNSLGTICGRSRDWDKAIEFYEKTVSIKPDKAISHLNLGMELLRKGEFVRGWKEYEWRWQTPEFTPLNVAKPQWNGEEISDQVLMMHTEQGAGDAIQFIRYAPIVKQLCKRLVVLCPQHLYELFKLVEGIDELVLPGEIPLSLFDTYIPLLSVPKVLKTTPYNIPATIPYIKPILRPKIEDFMNQHLGNFNVGFTWTGSPTHKDNHLRSCQIIDLLPVLGTHGVTFFSLQKGDRVKDLKQLPNSVKVIDLDPHLEDYLDTAWAMTKLNLIISVDTSVIHLAGAIGKPVWTMLCYVPDWRWMRTKEDTPWYPSMRLFWQNEYKNWSDVVFRICDQLSQMMISDRNKGR